MGLWENAEIGAMGRRLELLSEAVNPPLEKHSLANFRITICSWFATWDRARGKSGSEVCATNHLCVINISVPSCETRFKNRFFCSQVTRK